MDAKQLLVHLLQSRAEALIRVARAFPADKLDWKASPASRSVLDQLQECATAIDEFWNAAIDRKIEYAPERFQRWVEDRSRLTTVDEIEAELKKGIERLSEYILALNESDLDENVDLPFPGKFNLADVLHYHVWNFGYHEGQITFIGTLLEAPAQA